MQTDSPHIKERGRRGARLTWVGVRAVLGIGIEILQRRHRGVSGGVLGLTPLHTAPNFHHLLETRNLALAQRHLCISFLYFLLSNQRKKKVFDR